MKSLKNTILEGLKINKNIKFNKKLDCINFLDDLIDKCNKSKFYKNDDGQDFIFDLEGLKQCFEKNTEFLIGSLNSTETKWVGIFTEVCEIMGVTERNVKEWAEDEDNEEFYNKMHNLNIGDVYDSDGGLHIYIRIRE